MIYGKLKEGKYPQCPRIKFLCYVYSFLSNILCTFEKIYELMSSDVIVLKSQSSHKYLILWMIPLYLVSLCSNFLQFLLNPRYYYLFLTNVPTSFADYLMSDIPFCFCLDIFFPRRSLPF